MVPGTSFLVGIYTPPSYPLSTTTQNIPYKLLPALGVWGGGGGGCDPNRDSRLAIFWKCLVVNCNMLIRTSCHNLRVAQLAFGHQNHSLLMSLIKLTLPAS